MELNELINNWKDKNILIIGETIVDKYIFGNVDSISPDAPVPNVRVNKSETFVGAIGLVLQFIQSLGGKPEICTVVGSDFEGDFFIKKIKELNVDTSNIIIDDEMITPQITRIKARNQHLLRLENDYTNEISGEIREKMLSMIQKNFKNIDSIIILDYGASGLFTDSFVQSLLQVLKQTYKDIPILARPNDSNYYLYEHVDLLKINQQKALEAFSIDCSTDTSISIVGKRILNSSKCKNLLLNYLEKDSYLFIKGQQKIEKFNPILKDPVRSFVAVGSVILAILSLVFASDVEVKFGVKIALYAAVLSAISAPVLFFNPNDLIDFIQKIEMNGKGIE